VAALPEAPDGVVAEEEESAGDADLAVEAEEIAEDAAEIEEDTEPRSLRLRELGLVLLVVFAGKLVKVLEAWSGLAPHRPSPSFDTTPTMSALWQISGSLAVLWVLTYVLFNQRSSLRQLGVTAKWSDLPLGLAVAVLGYLPYAAYNVASSGVWGDWRWLSSGPTTMALSLIGLVSLLTFAAKLGVVFQAYVFTEVLELSGSAILAVAASVLLLNIYRPHHTLTAALLPASTYLIFSLFYWKTRRATPLVLGHVLYGLMSMLFPVGLGR
jgi:hypothetical protein